jgi:hypothetical protein
MNWKYKHFYQERTYAAPRDVVLEAARTFMTEQLGWKIADSPEGLTAEGFSFAHQATAHLRVQPTAEGTKVSLDLSVSRAGATGFMLFDVGGYYNIQIRKWLDGIQWSIHQKLSPSQVGSAQPPMPVENKGAARLFNGCLAFIVVTFALYFVITAISAVVGLASGNLLLFGRGRTLVMHGLAARFTSALILLFGVFLVWKMTPKGKR